MKKLIQFFLCCFLLCSTQAFCETNANVVCCPIPMGKASFWHSPKNGINYKSPLPIIDSKFATQTKENKCSFIYFSKGYAQWEHTKRYIGSLLKYAKKNNLKVVFELPDIQENKDDQVLKVWTTIVNKLKDCPEVVAYSMPSFLSHNPDSLGSFHKKVVTELRKIDPSTPIILRLYDPKSFTPLQEKNILYALESIMVRPTVCMGPNGEFPNGSVVDARNQESIKHAKDKLNFLAIWAKQNGILPEQILISDFGTISGGEPDHKIDQAELDSFLEIIKANNWHSSFTYSSYTIQK